MTTITIEKSELKNLIKENLAELLKDRSELKELLEDLAFGELIKEGDRGKYVKEKEITKLLQFSFKNCFDHYRS